MVYLPDERLDRPVYVAVNAALEAIGGAWNRKAKAHVFSADPSDALDSLLLTGTYTKPQDFGFFPTPDALADQVIEYAGITPDMLVLEPSAGTGQLAHRAAQKGARVHCIEVQDHLTDALSANGFYVLYADFLNVSPAATYDRVVMNPPFARQQDIAHVQHAWEFVKPGGRLVSVMAAGVSFRNDRKATAFRDLVTAHGRMIANPPGSFTPSGTDVNTVTVLLDKAA
jgi:predicted RNA methylase